MKFEVHVDRDQRWLVEMMGAATGSWLDMAEGLVRLKPDDEPIYMMGRFEKFTARALPFSQNVTGLKSGLNRKVGRVLHRFDYDAIDEIIDILAEVCRDTWTLRSDYGELHVRFESERDLIEFTLSCPKYTRQLEEFVLS